MTRHSAWLTMLEILLSGFSCGPGRVRVEATVANVLIRNLTIEKICRRRSEGGDPNRRSRRMGLNSGRYRQSGTRLRNCGNPSERVEKWGYAMLLVITLPLSCAATYSV
jgi:hypothetical protein